MSDENADPNVARKATTPGQMLSDLQEEANYSFRKLIDFVLSRTAIADPVSNVSKFLEGVTQEIAAIRRQLWHRTTDTTGGARPTFELPGGYGEFPATKFGFWS